MARNQKDFTFDYALQLKDAGAVSADGAATVGGSAKILDLGQSRFDGRVIIDVTAIEVDTANEHYLLKTQFSDVADFDTGSEVIKGGTALHMGDLTVTKDTADTPVGRYELPFTNEINGTTYRYMRMWTEIVGGTVVTGINYTAFVVTP